MSGLTGSVREKLISGILSGEYQPGEKLPAEREFALKNSISRITVRRAFAQLEAAGIIVRKRPSGTYVADHFQAHKGELKSIGLITALPHEFSGKFVGSVSDCCEKEDILLALGIPQEESAQKQFSIACRMVSRGVKNLIVWGAEQNGGNAVFERLRILGVNMVFFDQVIPGNYADFVGLDNCQAVSDLFDAAVRRGKKELIFLNYSDLAVDSNFEREAEFLRKAAESGIKSGVYKIPRHCSLTECRDFLRTLPDNRDNDCAVIGVNGSIIKKLFPENPRNYALFCVDDLPEWNDLEVSCCAQPVAEMAAGAVEMLKNQCRKGEKWQSTIRRFAGELIER